MRLIFPRAIENKYGERTVIQPYESTSAGHHRSHHIDLRHHTSKRRAQQSIEGSHLIAKLQLAGRLSTHGT